MWQPDIIRMKMHNKEIFLALTENILNTSSIKSGFLLPDEAVVSLSYELIDRVVHCEMNDEGTFFVLPVNFSNFEFTVESDKTPSKPLSLDVDGEVVFRVCKYAWFYTIGDNLKQSAIPVTKNFAITYRHGKNQYLIEGDCITLSSNQNQVGNQQVDVETSVVLIDDALDLIVLESKSAEICDRDLIFEAAEPIRGLKYVSMGYSVKNGQPSQISFSAGIISTDITSRLRYLGTSGSFQGDSGGSCWNYDGKLIGMQVGIEKIPRTTENNDRTVSPALRGQCRFVPITAIQAVIVKLLPPKEEAVQYVELSI